MRNTLPAFFCFVLCCGCATHSPQPASTERALAPGDCIIVDNIHQQGLGTRHLVDAAGDISLTLLGKFHVAGLTLKQAELGIEKEYVDRGLYRRVDLIVLPCP